METNQIMTGLEKEIAKQSGLEPHRSYLGISKISDCPRRAVREYLHGMKPNETAYRMSLAGYEHERNLLGLLVGAGIAKCEYIEVVAPFDARFKGHIDAQTIDGELIEIKSVSTIKYSEVVRTQRTLRKHFEQVQLYMRYGGWNYCFVVYRCRENYMHKIIRVPYISRQAEALEQRAKRMLEFIDNGKLPPCECGHCQQ